MLSPYLAKNPVLSDQIGNILMMDVQDSQDTLRLSRQTVPGNSSSVGAHENILLYSTHLVTFNEDDICLSCHDVLNMEMSRHSFKLYK
jgi:hypothetical protein